MTRWKRESTTVIREMLEHHRFSRWHDHVLNAAQSMGLVIGYRRTMYRAVDGGWYESRQWYVMTDQLASIGGESAVNAAARKLADKEYEQREAS